MVSTGRDIITKSLINSFYRWCEERRCRPILWHNDGYDRCFSPYGIAFPLEGLVYTGFGAVREVHGQLSIQLTSSFEGRQESIPDTPHFSSVPSKPAEGT